MSHREAASNYALEKSRDKRDIGEIPHPKNPDRKDRGSSSLSSFCREYQPAIFTRPFAPMHKEVINRLEAAITGGGLFAYAMPRGTGKTSIAEAACIWALLTGKRRYVVLISATEKQGQQNIENIKKELATNRLILEDWPREVYPIWALEGISHRAAGQLYHGESTHIVWRGEQLVFPMIPGSKTSGSVLEVRGITGALRGMKCNLPGGGGAIRPELVVLDDPQTDESARSPTQCKDRERITLGTILGLAGHEQEIAAVMPCTVIQKGDLAERFLDREKRPEWHGMRSRLLTEMPKNANLWDEYNDLKRDSSDKATQFYIENRDAMDEGAEPMWKECLHKHQLSAIQYAMDLRSIVGEYAFWAEYQNEPLEDASDGEMVTVDDITHKTTSFTRWQVPPNCQHLTSFIDVHKKILYYMVCGWEESFNGYIVQYGVWPETKRRYFSLVDIRETLQGKYPNTGVEGAIYAGLKELTDKLLNKTWGTSGLPLERCIVDANWKTSLVKSFCREAGHAAVLIPGHGRYVGADRQSLMEMKKASGDRVGLNWRVPAALSRAGIRHVIFDTNYWKTFINTVLLTPPGDRGCLQLFRGMDHQLVAEHITSEYYVEVSGRGRVVNHWSLRPGRRDNHWFDCLVGCAVGASMQGCRTVDTRIQKRIRRPVRYMEI